MSDRPIIKPTPVISAQSMASSITGTPTIMLRMSMASYSFSWSGTSPVGTISIQVSDDYAEDSAGKVSNAGTWNSLPLSLSGSLVTSIPVSGNTGQGFVDVDSLSAYAIRPIYTAASGTGSLTALVSGKVS